MQPHHMIGGSLALVGILDLVILITFLLPKSKAPPQAKKLMTIIIAGSGLAMFVAGAVISLLGEPWFAG